MWRSGDAPRHHSAAERADGRGSDNQGRVRAAADRGARGRAQAVPAHRGAHRGQSARGQGGDQAHPGGVHREGYEARRGAPDREIYHHVTALPVESPVRSKPPWRWRQSDMGMRLACIAAEAIRGRNCLETTSVSVAPAVSAPVALRERG